MELWSCERVGCTHSNAAEEIEDEVPKVSQAVLYVVAKDEQKPHVADDMHPAAVQEIHVVRVS